MNLFRRFFSLFLFHGYTPSFLKIDIHTILYHISTKTQYGFCTNPRGEEISLIMRKSTPCGVLFLYLFLHESVLVAVEIQVAATAEGEPCFGVALRVKLYHLQPIGSNGCNERYEVLLCHRMVNGDKMLVLHLFYGNCMIVIGLFSL